MWYMSGNRDEDVFDDPFTLTIDRNPNPHQASGGGDGAGRGRRIHLCLGSALGKQMLKSEIWEIYTRMGDLEVGKPELMLSNFMNGVMKLPGTWTPEKA